MGKKRKTKEEIIKEKFRNCEIDEEQLDALLSNNEMRLEKKRKYHIGEPIIDAEELFECEYVYCFGNRPTHIAFLSSMPFRFVMNMLKSNRIKRAIKKE